MTFTSYAQNFEDVMLWRALRDVTAGAYLDLGAFDPVFHSVSRGFYECGWRGIHVEASRHYVECLRAARPDETVIEAIVADRSDRVEFFQFEGTGLSTVDAALADRHRQAGHKCESRIVRSMTLDEIFKTADRDPIHWLKIDVEGSEAAALSGWRRAQQRPWIVLVEAVHPVSRKENHLSWEVLLLRKGYKFAYFDGLNRFYVSKEKRNLLRHFRHGWCLWDDIVISPDHQLASGLRRAEQQSLESVTCHSDDGKVT